MARESVTSSKRRVARVSGSAAIEFDRVSLAFDDNVVLREVTFTMQAGRLTVLLGASGTGKSTILKLILGLLKPDSGFIHIHGVRTDAMTESELMEVRGGIGMLFQESALFDSLTVADNVGYRLYEETGMPAEQVRTRVEEVLGFVGLSDYLDAMPADLSGGQRRRVAIARAMAAQPEILLFDDPTSGLDPITAKTVDDEIIKVRDLQGVTPVVVTHQVPAAFYIASHQASRRNGQIEIRAAAPEKTEEAEFLVLKDGSIFFQGHTAELRTAQDPYLKSFLTGWVPPLSESLV